MRRAELYVCPIALAVSACMKIYPDPELPDVVVDWADTDCNPDAIVALSLVGVDTPTLRTDVDVACEAWKYTFADVARERFHVDGALWEDGEVVANHIYEVDLRSGVSDTAYLYFGEGGYFSFKVAWTFDLGSSCESVGANAVDIVFSVPEGVAFAYTAPCSTGMLRGFAPDGTYTVRAVATAAGIPVAVSPPTPELTWADYELMDIGTLVLSPCNGECL